MAQARIGYAAMLEQFGPPEVLDLCARADAAGFSGVMAADHFQPWVPSQGQASFVWEILAVAGSRTKGDLGPGRYAGGDVPRPDVVGTRLRRGPQ
jgi:coenzyme F420-dependent glucose-6-phosphate dehydrogenase